MKAKKFYLPTEYIDLLDFCIKTTNIGSKAESIIRSIYRRYVCNEHISVRQYEALHNISVMCAGSDSDSGSKAWSFQTILRTIRGDGEPDKLPMFVMDNDFLRLPFQSQSQEETNVPILDRVGTICPAVSLCADPNANSAGDQRSDVFTLQTETQIGGTEIARSTGRNPSGISGSSSS